MWNLTSDDIQHAKDRIELRRAEVEARYAEERGALDAEFAVIETLERAAREFALKHSREDIATASETIPPAEIGVSDGGEGKLHSRWRLHLGTRPSDADGAGSSMPPVAR